VLGERLRVRDVAELRGSFVESLDVGERRHRRLAPSGPAEA
jgi:hypothetical protein